MYRDFADVFFGTIEQPMKVSPLERITMFEEGFRPVRYKCSMNFWSIGYGHRIKPGEQFTALDKGRAYWLMRADLREAQEQAETLIWFKDLDKCRQDAVIALIFQLGFTGYRKFKKHIAAMAKQDYQTASAEILDSDYNKQCFNRSTRVARWINLGKYPEVPE